jgi:hypothetical protein
MSSTTYINRANAQRSTGPKTVAGKQRSSQNALRHGLTGQTVVMPTEDLRAYEAHVKSFQDEYQPQGATEAQLVKSLADTSWRLNRVASFEATLLSHPAAEAPAPSRFPRAEAQRLHAVAVTFVSQSRALSNLSLHSNRLSREFERTVAQLRKLQETRRALEQKGVTETREKAAKPHIPAKDGFVFTDPKTAEARRARLVQESSESATTRDTR